MRWERSAVRGGVEESREVNVDNSGKVERREVRLKEKDGVGDRIRKYSINVRVIWGNKVIVIVIVIDIVMLMFIYLSMYDDGGSGFRFGFGFGVLKNELCCVKFS